MSNGTTISPACQELLDKYNFASYEKDFIVEPAIQDAKDRRIAAGLVLFGSGVTAITGLLRGPFGLLVSGGGAVGAALSYRSYKKAQKDLSDARRKCTELRRQMAEAWTDMVQGGTCPENVIPPRSEVTKSCG